MLGLICSIFDMTVLIIYFNAIMKKRKETIPFPLFLLVFIAAEGILYIASLFFSYKVQTHAFYFMALISSVTLFLQTYLYEGKLVHRFFAMISFQLYAILSEGAIFFIATFLPRNLGDKLLENTALCAIISKFFLFLFIVITNLLFLRKKKIFSVQYTLLICIMPIVSIMILLTIPNGVSTDDNAFPLSLVGAVGLLFANIVNYYLLDNILHVKELKKDKEQLNQQLAFQSTKYQQISAAYRNTRSLIHDSKKHYFFIQECVKNKHYDVIDNYIKTSLQDIEQSYNRINTGNLVIDAFVSNYLSMAERENIEFLTDIQVSFSNIQIDDYDFSIILGNLLDNSLEACREIQFPFPRQIAVSIHTSSRELLIHIYNSISKQKKENSKDELKHGYGTVNIENITLKYYGTYTHYIEKDRYHAIVSIPCNIPE